MLDTTRLSFKWRDGNTLDNFFYSHSCRRCSRDFHFSNILARLHLNCYFFFFFYHKLKRATMASLHSTPWVQVKVSHFKRQVAPHLTLSPESHQLYFINSLGGRGCPLISCLSRQPDSKSASGLVVPDDGNQRDRNMCFEMIQQVPPVPTPSLLPPTFVSFSLSSCLTGMFKHHNSLAAAA